MSTFIKRLYKGANISVHKESQFNSYKTDNRKIIGNVKTQSAIGNNTKKKKKIYLMNINSNFESNKEIKFPDICDKENKNKDYVNVVTSPSNIKFKKACLGNSNNNKQISSTTTYKSFHRKYNSNLYCSDDKYNLISDNKSTCTPISCNLSPALSNELINCTNYQKFNAQKDKILKTNSTKKGEESTEIQETNSINSNTKSSTNTNENMKFEYIEEVHFALVKIIQKGKECIAKDDL